MKKTQQYKEIENKKYDELVKVERELQDKMDEFIDMKHENDRWTLAHDIAEKNIMEIYNKLKKVRKVKRHISVLLFRLECAQEKADEVINEVK